MNRTGRSSGDVRTVTQAFLAVTAAFCLLGDLPAVSGEAADAVGAYAEKSDAVWALFAQRKYAEADELLATLGTKPEAKAAAAAYQADVEAARLLKQFWAAVEQWMVDRKGQFVAISGAAGTVVGVERGVVSIQRGKETLTRRVDQVTTKQAIAYARLKTDELSSLMKGVFLLAERSELDDAKAALDAAGESGHAAVYRARLAAVMAKGQGAAESATGSTPGEWQDLLGAGNTKKWKLIASIGDVLPGRRAGVKVGISVLQSGKGRCAMQWTDEFPRSNYEVTFLANRDEGKRFGAVVFPIGDVSCSWVLGGEEDGTHTGIELIDGLSYKDKKNPTYGRSRYEKGRWYRFRIRVTDEKVETWVEGREAIRLTRAGHRFSPNDVAETLGPFGFTANRSTLGIKSLRVRTLGE
jgi:hypothetical protein